MIASFRVTEWGHMGITLARERLQPAEFQVGGAGCRDWLVFCF